MRMRFAGAGRRHGRSHAEAVARADDKPRWLEAFSFTAVGGEVPAARRRVETELVQLGLTGRARFDLMAAVGEALNNAVGHGSPYEEFDDVIVRIGVIAGGVMVEITDKGKGLSSARICPPDALADSGRGIPSMRALVDDLRIECDGAGTTVFLVKLIPE